MKRFDSHKWIREFKNRLSEDVMDDVFKILGVMGNALAKAKNIPKSYRSDYGSSLLRMIDTNKNQFVKDYGNFTEEDFIEDVQYNLQTERKKLTEQPAGFDKDPDSTFDFNYYDKQLGEIFEQLEEFEMAIITDLEYGVDDGNYTDYAYEQMPDQIRRYLNATQRQLESLQKYLQRTERRMPK